MLTFNSPADYLPTKVITQHEKEVLDGYISNKLLTPQQSIFLRGLIQGLGIAKAAKQAWPDCKNKQSAYHTGYVALKKLRLSLKEILEISGLPLAEDIEDLKRLRKAKTVVNKQFIDDNATQLKALELTCKLKGVLKEDENSSGVIYNQMGAIQINNITLDNALAIGNKEAIDTSSKPLQDNELQKNDELAKE